MNLLFWKKESGDTAAATTSPYEEIQEKKTTKLGYFFLLLMIVIGFWQGEGFIESLSRNIPDLERLSSCSYQLQNIINSKNNNDYSYSYGNYGIKNCQYSTLEKENNIPFIIDSLVAKFSLSETLYQEKSNLENAKYRIENSISSQKQTYNISLTEKIAGENTNIYNKEQVRLTLEGSEHELAQTILALDKNKQAQVDVTAQIESAVKSHKAEITKLFDSYERSLKIVAFERALLLFVFITPLFYFCIRRYFKLKKENSHFTIIWGAVTAIFALLFAQVFFTFLYQILPRTLIAKLIAFFGQFAFLVTIGQYLLLLITPIIFGGIVYVIQKKVYNSEAVAVRAFKSGKCPRCEMKTDREMNHCPLCACTLKAKCPACGEMTPVAGKYCEKCGAGKYDKK